MTTKREELPFALPVRAEDDTANSITILDANGRYVAARINDEGSLTPHDYAITAEIVKAINFLDVTGRGGEKGCGHWRIERVDARWRCAACHEGFMSYNDAQVLLARAELGGR